MKISRNRVEWKFTAIFGAIFWITAIILYAFVFLYIYTELRQESRMGIQVRLLGYWAVEKSSGLDELKDTIDVNKILSGEEPFFVRIADSLNNTEYLAVPKHWSSFDFSVLEKKMPVSGNFILLKSETLGYMIETGCIQISEDHYLQVGVSDENRRKIMRLLSESFTAALIVLVVVSSIIGFTVAFNFLRPVRALEKTVGEIIKTGKIDSRIVENKGAGELDKLAVSFNQMLQKIEELVYGMKGALDTVAHDLRTPLTRFRIVAEKALSQQYGPEEKDLALNNYRTALEQSIVESETLIRMMNMLMDISEAETGTLKLNITEFNPIDNLIKLVDVYEFAAEDRNIKIEIIEPSYKGAIKADPDRFRQAAGNLIDNALKYGL
ncbi:MAG: HAMP domain-containing protein, partial [Spirochaetales bacterium]|nr:HAMP domain-containing protein [Spirochaetales bacterium]